MRYASETLRSLTTDVAPNSRTGAELEDMYQSPSDPMASLMASAVGCMDSRAQAGQGGLCGTVQEVSLVAPFSKVPSDMKNVVKEIWWRSKASRLRELVYREELRAYQQARQHVEMQRRPARQRKAGRVQKRPVWLGSTLIRMGVGARRTKHIDPGPEDLIVMQSLTGVAQMTFRSRSHLLQIPLHMGKCVVISGAARHSWSHEVTHVLSERWAMVHRYALRV